MINFAKSQVFVEFTFIRLNKIKFIEHRKSDFSFNNIYFVGSYTQPPGAALFALLPATSPAQHTRIHKRSYRSIQPQGTN
jgi:hypothetical protein